MRISNRRDSKVRMNRPIAIEISRNDADGKELPQNQFRLIASTDTDYDWGYYREKLMHGRDNVDMAGAVSVLFNHDPNQLIGGIQSCEVDGQKMTSIVEIDPNAVTPTGMKIADAINKKYVRGVSIGYDYRREDCTFTEDDSGKRNVVVRKWQLREISITPTPADLSAQVTRQRSDWAREAFAAKETITMEFSQWLAARGLKEVDLSVAEISLLKRTYDAELKLNPAPKKDDPAPLPGDELAKERKAKEDAQREASVSKIKLELIEVARSHNVEIKLEELTGLTKEQGLALLLERKAKSTERKPEGSTVVDITADVLDKQNDAACNALLSRGGIEIAPEKLQGNPFIARRAIEIGRRLAQIAGIRGAPDWADHDVGLWMLERVSRRGMRSANVTADMFGSYVLINAMDKAVALGFKAFGEAGQSTYKRWTRTRQVADFKTVTGAALDVGNLQKTVEDAPFPELSKAEFGYQSALAMWGVTAALTIQTLVNDDLGEFMNQIFRSGQIANRTIEKEVYAQLEALTWTGNTSSGAGLGTGASPTPANLDVARNAFIGKTGPTGEKLGNVPRFLLHQPTQGVPVGIALGRVINYNGVSGSVQAQSLEPIETPYFAGTATTYYLVGDPALVDTVILLMLAGMMTPQIEEFDAGAVAARKWKIYLPFTAKPVAMSVNLSAGGTAIIAPGMQQATV